MGRYWILCECIIIGTLFTNTYSLEEKENQRIAEIVVTEDKSLKKIELRNPSDITTMSGTSPIIHQGNNLFIKPNFIIGSPFTSFKRDEGLHGCCDDAQNGIAMENPSRVPQLPVVSNPPVFVPPGPPFQYPIPSSMPFLIPHPCLSKQPSTTIDGMILVPPSCPPYVVPVSPEFPKFPVIQNPVEPIVIPRPPELPPLILPKLPINVIIQKPPTTVSIPDKPIIIPTICSPFAKCQENNSPVTRGLNTMFKKLRRILHTGKIDLSKILLPNEETTVRDNSATYPTLGVQTIVAERVLPNMY